MLLLIMKVPTNRVAISTFPALSIGSLFPGFQHFHLLTLCWLSYRNFFNGGGGEMYCYANFLLFSNQISGGVSEGPPASAPWKARLCRVCFVAIL